MIKENCGGGQMKTSMKTSMISYKHKPVPVFHRQAAPTALKSLGHKLQEMEFNFEFRRKWKGVQSIELVGEVAILQYNDGTKLYLAVS
jgi:hypothetical protein